MEEVNKLKSLGGFVILERLESQAKTTLKVIHKEAFSKGKVVGIQDQYSNLPSNTEVIYITEKASQLGLDYPANVFVIRYEDIIAIC